MKKIISVMMSAAMTFTATVPYIAVYNQDYVYASSGISVAEHTPQEIKAYIEANDFDPWVLSGIGRPSPYLYKTTPSTSSPYEIGELSDSELENSLNALNCMRYIAGLPEVSLNSEYTKLAQAASLVNCVNDELTHYPEQPSDMPDDIYKLGYQGASSSNLAGGGRQCSAAYSILLYMEDSDPYNIEDLGHRRWCLNPSMKETGFGWTKEYTAMYAFDTGRTDATEKGVCWPAQNMPVEYFSELQYSGYEYAWSISMGEYVNKEDVQVTLTRKSDSEQWNFSSSSADGDFYVDNSYYGQKGCIIFRPSGVSYSAGDVFDVKITGLEEPVEYTVNFFSLDDIPSEPVTYSFGDVNADGEINANDASDVLAEYAAVSTNQTGTLSDGQKQAADINGDGKIDAADASTILAYYAYLSTGGAVIDMREWLSQQ